MNHTEDVRIINRMIFNEYIIMMHSGQMQRVQHLNEKLNG